MLVQMGALLCDGSAAGGADCCNGVSEPTSFQHFNARPVMLQEMQNVKGIEQAVQR
jgi:hypothetical protein